MNEIKKPNGKKLTKVELEKIIAEQAEEIARLNSEKNNINETSLNGEPKELTEEQKQVKEFLAKESEEENKERKIAIVFGWIMHIFSGMITLLITAGFFYDVYDKTKQSNENYFSVLKKNFSLSSSWTVAFIITLILCFFGLGGVIYLRRQANKKEEENIWNNK